MGEYYDLYIQKLQKDLHAVLLTRPMPLFYKSWIILECDVEND